jgi:hypothetical protein
LDLKTNYSSLGRKEDLSMTKIKRGPLSKAEIFYIEGNFNKLSHNQIASDLNRPVKSIDNYVSKIPREKKEKNNLTVGDQFVRQGGATIMTENASTLSDSKKTKKPLHNNCTVKIK